jgi:hypothetical protein
MKNCITFDTEIKTMNTENWKLWDSVTFKTTSYRRNFDLINDNENIITEYEGNISEVRISEHKPPILIGEYLFSVWNLELGKMFNVDLNELFESHHFENIYDEFLFLMKNKLINIDKYRKIMFISNLILKPDYRKREISEEFIEFIYRDYYNEDTAIIALVKPIQNNVIDFDFYMNHRNVEIFQSTRKKDGVNVVSGKEYYSLNDLSKKDDGEMNEYKLFSLAVRLGFSRISDSHLFIYTPDATMKRMFMKRNEMEKRNLFS